MSKQCCYDGGNVFSRIGQQCSNCLRLQMMPLQETQLKWRMAGDSPSTKWNIVTGGTFIMQWHPCGFRRMVPVCLNWDVGMRRAVICRYIYICGMPCPVRDKNQSWESTIAKMRQQKQVFLFIVCVPKKNRRKTVLVAACSAVVVLFSDKELPGR